MADKRLLTEERLDDCRKVASSINDGMTPDHRAFIHNLLGQGVPALLAHIEAQAERMVELDAGLKVTWTPCAEGLPTIGHPVCWIANYEQLWGMATLTDGTDCHSEDYWWLEAQQSSLAQMFVTHWAEVDFPEPPQKEEHDVGMAG